MRGLSVGGFAIGIVVGNVPNAVIAGNFVGLGPDGTTRAANANGIVPFIGATGLRVGTDGNGVADAAERNVLSGNDSNGISINATSNLVFAGNYVGLNAAGTAAVANGIGISVFGGTGLRVGTNGDGVADAAERNVVSGNSTGISVSNGATGAVIAGNTIGLDATGTAAVGNGAGIFTNSVTGLRIGTNGDSVNDAAEANRVRGNTGQGVILLGRSDQASVLGNEITANGPPTGGFGLGIDLASGGASGVTLNDAGDSDTGPNGLQNFPVIVSARTAEVAFTLNSIANTTYRIEAFASAAADPTGYGEGERFLGFTNVTTDASGNASGTFTPTGLADGEFVALTATPVTVNAQGAVTGFPAGTGTSEFSLAVRATAAVQQASSIYNPSSAQGDGAGYRLLGAPVAGYRINELAALNLVQGVPAGATTPAQYPLAGYNVLPTYLGGGSTFDNFPRPSGTDMVLEPGRGFYWHLYDRDIAATSGFGGGTSASRELTGFAFSATGTSPTADVSVAFADNAGAGQDNFQMLANPFARPLAVAGITATGGVLQGGIVQAYDLTPTGPTFVTLGLAGDAVPDVLAVWQGAFGELVPAAAGNPVTVTYAFAQTQPGTTPPFYGKDADTAMAEAAPPAVFLALTGTLASGAPVADRAAVVRFMGAAEAGWDALDASKLTPLASDYALLAPAITRDGAPYRLAVDSRPLAAAAVPLSFATTGAGAFALSWTLAGRDSTSALPQGWTATLTDTATGETVNLATATRYAFTADAAESWSDRFMLAVAPREATAGDETGAGSLALYVSPNPVSTRGTVRVSLPEAGSVRVVLYDVLGRQVAVLSDGERPAGTHDVALDASRLAPGVYVVRLTTGESTVVRRVTVAR